MLICIFAQNKESFRSTLHDSLFHMLTLSDPKLDVGPAVDPQTLTNALSVGSSRYWYVPIPVI